MNSGGEELIIGCIFCLQEGGSTTGGLQVEGGGGGAENDNDICSDFLCGSFLEIQGKFEILGRMLLRGPKRKAIFKLIY